MEEMKILSGTFTEEREKLRVICENKECISSQQLTVEANNHNFLVKEGKRFVENSVDAKAVQKQYSELKNKR